MHVQLNSDHHIVGSPGLLNWVQSTLEEELKRFEDRITRIEVHFNDENAQKGGDTDKRCMLEARLAGHQPVSVVHRASTLNLALDGAIERLTNALSHTLEKLETQALRRAQQIDSGNLTAD